jgi:hypothetical protein
MTVRRNGRLVTTVYWAAMLQKHAENLSLKPMTNLTAINISQESLVSNNSHDIFRYNNLSLPLSFNNGVLQLGGELQR